MSRIREKSTEFLSRTEKISVRRRLTLVALLVVVFAAVLVSVSNYIFLAHTPEKAVKNYLNSLQSGNYFAAVDRSVYGDSSAIFLKNSMYRAASGRVEDYKILSIEENGNKATAHVRITVQGSDREVELPLIKKHRSGLYNDTWKLDGAAQVNEMFTTPVAFDRIMVNGKSLKLNTSRAQQGESGYSWLMPLLPGEYVFSLPEDSYYRIVGGEQVVKIDLLQQEVAALNLHVRPSERMWNETDSAIDSWLSKCESSQSLAPVNCPVSAVYDSLGRPLDRTPQTEDADQPRESSRSLSTPTSAERANITDVEWKLVSRPSLRLQQSADSAETWIARRREPAVFELTYRVDGEDRSETVRSYIDAQVISSGSAAAISVGPGETPDEDEEQMDDEN